MANPSVYAASFSPLADIFVTVKREHYVAHSNRAYSGNPWIEALEQYDDPDWLLDSLERLPDWDIEDRKLSTAKRKQLVLGLTQLIIALPRVLELAEVLIHLVMEGYRGREPFKAAFAERMQSIYDARMRGSRCKDHLKPSGRSSAQLINGRQITELVTALIGPSGSCKSKTIERVQNLFPCVLYHEIYNVWQIPVLIIRLPPDGRSLHNLATAIIEAICELLPHAGYAEKYLKVGRGNSSDRVLDAARLLHLHVVGALLVDESQDNKHAAGRKQTRRRSSTSGPHEEVSDTSPEAPAPLINFLIAQARVLGVPMVMVGTNELMDVLNGRLTRSRRAVGYGMKIWGMLSSNGDIFADALGEFELLLWTLFSYQWLRIDVPLTQPLADLWFELTQGNADLVVKLYQGVVLAALTSGDETFEETSVTAVWNEQFTPVHGAMSAFRDNDPARLVRFPDIAPLDLRAGATYMKVATRMSEENIARKKTLRK